MNNSLIIVIPYNCDGDVVMTDSGEVTFEPVCHNTVGEVEIMQRMREALRIRMLDRNSKQLRKLC